MAIKNAKVKEQIKSEVMAVIIEALTAHGYTDVDFYKSNGICTPVVGGEDLEEGYVQVTVSIPKGSRDGEEWDGYEEVAAYKRKLENDKIKAEKAAAEKAKKVERDRKAREAKAKARAEAEAEATK